MRGVLCLLIALLGSAPLPAQSGPAHVEVVSNGDGFALERNGEPYRILGAGAKAHSGISHGYSRTNLETAPMGVTADPALGSLCCWLPDLAETSLLILKL